MIYQLIKLVLVIINRTNLSQTQQLHGFDMVGVEFKLPRHCNNEILPDIGPTVYRNETNV
jgi:hypothetical protein